MPNKLYTAELRQKMRSKDYELLYPRRRTNGITIGRQKKGCGYIYINKSLREELKLDKRVYCYIHKKGNKLLLSFTEEANFLGYRNIKNRIIGIPGRLVKPYLGKGKKKTIPAHVEDGNIFVDLEELHETEKA